MSDRLLFLERFLMENTDEDTAVTTGDILDAYEKHNFGGNRNLVPADIEKLREAGIEIESQAVLISERVRYISHPLNISFCACWQKIPAKC